MKGLLIKDFKLLTRQKTTLIAIFVLLLFFPIMGMEPGFTVGYTMMVLLFITISTVAYDDFDNGMLFLFTLPVDRKTYVREKYVLGLMTGIGGWLLGVILNGFYFVSGIALQDQGSLAEMLLPLLLLLPVGFIMWMVMLPMQIKFGSERAKMVLFVVVGVVAVAALVVAKIAEQNEEQANIIVNRLAEILVGLSPMLVGVVLFVITVVGILISYACSVRIVEKKEF